MSPNNQHISVLLLSVFIIAICSITYELIIGTLSAYLFGNSVLYFSLTIGLFMSAMGIGAYLSRFIDHSLLEAFILLEIAIGLVGGCAAGLLYTTFVTSNLYHLAMVLLILTIGTLIGGEIPLLTRLSGGWTPLKDSLANILAFDYLGALFGSLLFPFVLLPQLGLLKSSFIMGLLNMLVVILNLIVFWRQLHSRRLLTTTTTVITSLLIAGTIWSVQLTSFFENRLYRDEIILAEQTPYQRIILTRFRDDVRLFLDGNLQFSSIDEYRYHELLTHPAMSLTQSRESVLILGGGDGLVAREVLKYDEVQQVVLVDLDPRMTDLAQTHPVFLSLNHNSLADPRLQVVNQDAFNYIAESSHQFGVILIDLPDPNNEALAKLYSREFYNLVRRHLAVGGVMTTQATSPYFARDAYWSIVATIEAAEFYVWPYHAYIPTFGDWGFVMAAEYQLPNVPPETFSPDVPRRYVTPQLFATTFLFDSDTAQIEADVSTLNHPIILDYYRQAWQQWN